MFTVNTILDKDRFLCPRLIDAEMSNILYSGLQLK